MRHGVRWGVVLGVAIIAWTMAIHLMGFYTTRVGAGLIADNVATILPLAAITFALLERRRVAGSLTIGQAVATGAMVGLVSAPISALFLWAYHHYVNPQWVDYLVEHARVQGAASGQTAAEIEQHVTALRTGSTDTAQISGAFIGSVLIGAVSGLILGVILRRKPATPSMSNH